jgi:Ser/Thr protein kinase RdoA (MazF antagonist)
MPPADALRDRAAVVDDVLTAVVPRARRVGAVRVLDGGLSNRVYAVTTTVGVFAVKLREAGPGVVLSLQEEADLTGRAAAAGLAPEVVGTDGRYDALVTVYRADARPWTRAVAREDENLRRAADLLRALHAVPDGSLREFRCLDCALRYIDAAGGPGADGTEQASLAAEFVQLAEDYEATHPPSVLCHNDLIADNILDDGGLVLVDFEYAMRAAPILDLASFAAMNRLGAAERRALLVAYYADAGVPPTGAEFAKVVRLLHLMAYFWARAAAREAAEPARFAEFGGRDALTKY